MLTVSRVDTHVVVAINAHVEGATLHRVLGDLVDDQGNRGLSVEVHEPTGIDSVGLAALLHTAQRLVTRGGHFEMQGASDEVVAAVSFLRTPPDPTVVTVADCDDAIRTLFALGLALRGVEVNDGTDELLDAALNALDQAIKQVRLAALRLTPTGEGQ